ncbi:hypothetical protein KC19_5G135300 [Ceratodon purpureus]|uniref:Uncharacterized protein n=1 Tax=Ceratodon purpureus TaxID=3225 RepID=A0A8T0I130_CERPU|nr:hypothetical protein KC19_5G135300 [Ceratodon purpureus]
MGDDLLHPSASNQAYNTPQDPQMSADIKFLHFTPSDPRAFPTKRSPLFSMPGKRPMRVTIGNCATPSYRPNETSPKGDVKGLYSASLGAFEFLMSLLILSTTTSACLPARYPCLISCNTSDLCHDLRYHAMN